MEVYQNRLKKDRNGEEKYSNDGCLMKIIKYNNANDIIVEFQDEYHYQTKSQYSLFRKGTIKNWGKRIGEKTYNNQGMLMTIVAYRRSDDIDVKFEDDFIVKNTTYQSFKLKNIRNRNYEINYAKIKKHMDKIIYNSQQIGMKIIRQIDRTHVEVEFLDDTHYKTITLFITYLAGKVINPYAPTVYGVGIIGENIDCCSKEYEAWHGILRRCFDEKTKIKRYTYEKCTVCNSWLTYKNFFNWLHQQENFEKWLHGDRWAVDKDIIFKGNKLYSPDTCFLVPNRVNAQLLKSDAIRGDYFIGVTYHKQSSKYESQSNDGNGNKVHLGLYENEQDAFKAYKKYKEKVIKKVANEEYKIGSITKRCYECLLNYRVEITD